MFFIIFILKLLVCTAYALFHIWFITFVFDKMFPGRPWVALLVTLAVLNPLYWIGSTFILTVLI